MSKVGDCLTLDLRLWTLDSHGRDERKSNRYPDFGLNLAPAFPIELVISGCGSL